MKKYYILICVLLLITVVTACSDTKGNAEAKEDPKEKELSYYKDNIRLPLENLGYDINEMNDRSSEINKTMVIIDTHEKLQPIVDAAESLASNANEILISLEDIENIPEEYKENHKNLLESLRKYRDVLETQYAFFHENQSEIVVNNELLKEGNWFAMSESMDLNEELETVKTDAKFAVGNLEQRVNTFEEKLNKK